MLTLGIIIGFIIGIVAGYYSLVAYAKYISGMSDDEIEDVGALMIKASKNRRSTISVETEDGYVDEIVLDYK